MQTKCTMLPCNTGSAHAATFAMATLQYDRTLLPCSLKCQLQSCLEGAVCKVWSSHPRGRQKFESQPRRIEGLFFPQVTPFLSVISAPVRCVSMPTKFETLKWRASCVSRACKLVLPGCFVDTSRHLCNAMHCNMLACALMVKLCEHTGTSV